MRPTLIGNSIAQSMCTMIQFNQNCPTTVREPAGGTCVVMCLQKLLSNKPCIPCRRRTKGGVLNIVQPYEARVPQARSAGAVEATMPSSGGPSTAPERRRRTSVEAGRTFELEHRGAAETSRRDQAAARRVGLHGGNGNYREFWQPRRTWMVAVVPLAIALHSRVAVADENADTSPEAADSATSKTKANPGTYQLPPPASRWKTVGLGLGFAGAWYAGAWGLREWFWSYSPGAADLRYPVIGPWMDLSKTGCPSNDTNCGKFGLVARTVLVVIDGIGQVGGLAVALDGLFTPTAPRASSQARSARHTDAPYLSPIPVPWSTTGGGGLSFVGQF